MKGKLITNIQFKEELETALQIGEQISLSGVIVYDRFEEMYMNCITLKKIAYRYKTQMTH